MAFGLLMGLSQHTGFLCMIQQGTRHPKMPVWILIKWWLQQKILLITHVGLPSLCTAISLFLQLPFSGPDGLMHKVTMVADTEILHGCSNHGLCVARPSSHTSGYLCSSMGSSNGSIWCIWDQAWAGTEVMRCIKNWPKSPGSHLCYNTFILEAHTNNLVENSLWTVDWRREMDLLWMVLHDI